MTTLYCILAREAETAVIFRRGPSKHVRLIKWDLKSDKFELGQWFRGRIYEKKCDLSPDGDKLVYFAAKFKYEADLQTWTAVSTVPNLKAHVLWQGMGTWNDISLFETNTSLKLSTYRNDSSLVPYDGFKTPRQLNVQAHIWPGYVYTRADHLRLVRDGWVVFTGNAVYPGAKKAYESQVLYHRPLLKKPHGACLALAVEAYGTSTYSLHDGVNDPVALKADWADARGKNIYYTSGGLLWRIPFAERKKQVEFGAAKQLADFEDMTFEAIEAPASALVW
jgi:hypothetical protein